MKQQQSKSEDAAELRRRAEERLRERQTEMELPQTKEEMLRLLHELQVHQIELEMENEEFRRAKDEWDATLDAMPDLVMIVDHHHHIVKVNKAMVEKLGKTSSDTVGLICYQDVHGTSEPPSFCPHMKLLNDGQEHTFEVYKERLGGDFLVSASPLRDKDGTVIGSVQIARDITERKILEGRLRESEAHYRSLVETLPDGLIILDSEGRVLSASDKYNKMFAVPPGATLVGTMAGDWVDPDYRKVVSSRIEEIVDKRLPVKPIEYKFVRYDRCSFWGEASSTVLLDGANRSKGMLSIIRDITERKRAEKALRESEFFFKESQRAAFIGSYETDFVAGLWESSEVLDQIFGIDKSYQRSVSGWLDIVHPDDREMMAHYLREDVIAKRSPFNKEYRIIRKFDQEVRWVNGLGEVSFDADGNVVSMIGTIQDITERKQLEKALGEKEAFNRCIIESSRDGINILDLEGRLQFMNPASQQLLEIEDFGKYRDVPYQDFWQGSDQPAVLEALSRARQGLIGSFNGFCPTTRGVQKWWDVLISPIFNPNGSVDRLLVVSRDITDRKQLEATRLFLIDGGPKVPGENFFESLARYLAENLGMNFVCIDGLEGDGLTARRIAVYFDGQFQDTITYALKDTLCGYAVGKTICCFRREVRLVFPKDKVLQEVAAESYVGTTLRGSEGKPIGLISVIGRQPLTDPALAESMMKLVASRTASELERRQAEEALRKALEALNELNQELESRVRERTADLQKEIRVRRQADERIKKSKNLLQQVFDGITDPLIMLDRSQKILMINKSAVDYYGGKVKDFLGKNLCNTELKKDKSACLDCKIPSAVSSDDYVVFERKNFMHPGRFEQVIIYPLRPTEDKEGAAIIRISDITEARLMEKQLLQSQKLASLGFLISGVAHEINNPNSFITFNIPILKDYLQEILPVLDDYAADHPDYEIFKIPYTEFRSDLLRLLENIEHGSQRINTIVSSLKEFAGQQEKKKVAAVDLRAVIEKGLTLCRGKISRIVKRLEVTISPDLPRLNTDPGTIEQVVINLLINAAQSADKEDSWVRLEVKKGKSRQERIIIEVSDNGCGMDEKTVEQIFVPFFTTKGPGEGTGLGLSVSHTQIEALGGRIEVLSEKGQGSTFRVFLRDEEPGRKE